MFMYLLSMTQKNLFKDFSASIVVFLVALPLCLGIALASGAPLISGIISGICGAIIVGTISQSQTSVSGPAAGLSAVVLSAITELGAFDVFLVSLVIAGVLQVLLGVFKLGFLADYFPSNVINGLLSAIGTILILKQLPHAVGYDVDSEGSFTFLQADGGNTFSTLINLFYRFENGTLIISIISLLILLIWDKTILKKLPVPAQLVVVVIAVLINEFFKSTLPQIVVGAEHLVSIPVFANWSDIKVSLVSPDFSRLFDPAVISIGFTLAIVATLETLLNLEAVDKLDPHKRHSPPNRELIGQGFGNIFSGLFGGIPVTSVIVRSSVNLNAGSTSKNSAIFHGILLLLSVVFFAKYLNLIPLCALAAILIITGFKLANIKLCKQIYKKGLSQFFPFVATLLGVVFTDILTGILLGLSVSTFFILRDNFFNPFDYRKEKYHKDETILIKLAPQVTFLHKARIIEMLSSIPGSSSVTIDASDCSFIDNDVIEIIKDFRDVRAPENNIQLNIIGFKEQYELSDDIKFVPTLNKDLQQSFTPNEVLNYLIDGNKRFVEDKTLNRKHLHHLVSSSQGQHPIATILSCIDSRAPAEIIFDVGLGDVFNIRIAGNIVDEEIIASIEFTCAVAGSKLLVVMGHTDCGAVKGACKGGEPIGLMKHLFDKVQKAIDLIQKSAPKLSDTNHSQFITEVAKANVRVSIEDIRNKSEIIRSMEAAGKIKLVPAMYDVATGVVEFI